MNGNGVKGGIKRKRKEDIASDAAIDDGASDAKASTSSSSPPAAKRGRGRPPKKAGDSKAALSTEPFVAPARTSGERGVLLTLGQGDTGQLGLGEDIMERSKPALVKNLENVVDVVAGGMHSVCLTASGEVFTFGCNDEGSLGRETPEDEECFEPGKVEIPGGGKVVQISAGDSHTVALTEDGRAYYWGTFRDGSGPFGLTPDGAMQKLPVPLAHHLRVKKVASGSDHVALLTRDGELYTAGTAEQGQLGRVGERFAQRGGRRGLGLLLSPDRVHAKSRRIAFEDVWAGSWSTYALTSDGDVLVCGLNNYCQLGVPRGQLFHTLVKSESFSRVGREAGGWRQIAAGQHHTIGLDRSKRAFAVGRVEYGRLGLGEEAKTDATEPQLIPGLEDIVEVSAGIKFRVFFFSVLQ